MSEGQDIRVANPPFRGKGRDKPLACKDVEYS